MTRKPVPENKHNTRFRGPSPDVGRATQFKPGQSGNPGGRPKKTPLTKAFEQVFGDPEFTVAQLRKIMAGKNDMAKVMLLKIAGDRLEGKVTAALEGNLTLTVSERMRVAMHEAEKRVKGLYLVQKRERVFNARNSEGGASA